MTTYSVTELLARVEATRRAFVDGQVADRVAEQRKWDRRFDDWALTSRPALIAALRDLLGVLEDDDRAVATPDVVPWANRHSSRCLLFFEGSRPRDLDVTTLTPPGFIDELENVLTSVVGVADGATVSSHMLEQAGVLRHVRRLVRQPCPSTAPGA